MLSVFQYMELPGIKSLLSSIESDKPFSSLELLLINALESLLAEHEKALIEIQNLKDEIKLLKGEKGKPKIKGNIKPIYQNCISSEKERKIQHKHRKKTKKDKIKIHRTEIRCVNPSILPHDAKFKGYKKVIIQNIHIKPDNICFQLECWYSPSLNKTFRAKMDEEYIGSEFSPDLRSFIIDLSINGRMSEYQINNFLNDKGIIISEGTISNILTKNLEQFHQEADNIFREGLQSNYYHQLDETGARHKGINGSTMVICGDYYTRFLTSESKNRFQIIKNINGNDKLTYYISKSLLDYIKTLRLPYWIYLVLRDLEGRYFNDQSEFEEAFKNQKWGSLPSVGHWNDVLYLSAVSGYLDQKEYKPIKVLICDDAPQYKIPGISTQLCWVHLGRNFKTLNPYVKQHQNILHNFLDEFWNYYHRLLAYKTNPTDQDKNLLSTDFDILFSTKTGYEILDKLISVKKEKKKDFLLVLEYPDIPIHNNHSEQQLRSIVSKRNISKNTRSDLGRKARDTWFSLMMTCKKYGIDFFDYLKDRLNHRGAIPALDELIKEKYRMHSSGFT